MKTAKICLALCLFLIMPASTRAAANLVRLTACEWAPHTSEKGDGYGALSKIVTEAFALEGVTVEYGFYPCKRALRYAQNGEWDGSVGWSLEKGRETFFHYSDPVIESKDVIFHLKEKPVEWTELSDLKDMKIGVGLGYFYGDSFKEAVEKKVVDVDQSVDDTLMLKKMLGGRIAASVINLHVGYYVLNQHFSKSEIARVTHNPKPVYATTIHMVLSKKVDGNDEMMEKFNRGLKKLRESGGYDEIMKSIEPTDS